MLYTVFAGVQLYHYVIFRARKWWQTAIAVSRCLPFVYLEAIMSQSRVITINYNEDSFVTFCGFPRVAVFKVF